MKSHDPAAASTRPDATPVLLLDEDAGEMWMNAPVEMALLLQRPPPPLSGVAAGEKRDGL